jgi:hypothetical protein
MQSMASIIPWLMSRLTRYKHEFKTSNKHGGGQDGRSAKAGIFVDCAYGIASAPGHPFYDKLSELLDAEGFDSFVEGVRTKFYNNPQRTAARYMKQKSETARQRGAK